MIRVALVRGKYLNNFEGQNYIFPKNEIRLTGISSLKPLHQKFPFPIIKLPSLADSELGGFGHWLVKVIANRTLGDSQILFGLEKYASKFDIFHTADPHYYYSYQLACLRAKNLIKKLLVTSWETVPFNNEGIKRKTKIKKFTQKFADLFICYTQKAKKTLILEGVDENKIKVVRLGVDLNRFKSQISNLKSQNQNLKPKIFNILFVGRLVEEKGIMDLYEAYKRVKSLKLKIKNYRLKLKIIGQGSLKDKIERMIKKDGLENLVTIEPKSYEEMPKVYQRADILVVPSKRIKTWEEQYGMVLVEGMASGLPIVAYDTGAISEVLDDVGLLVKEGDIDGLTGAIIRLIKDENLRKKLGRMGRKRAEEKFDRKKTAKKIQKIYQEVIDY